MVKANQQHLLDSTAPYLEIQLNLLMQQQPRMNMQSMCHNPQKACYNSTIGLTWTTEVSNENVAQEDHKRWPVQFMHVNSFCLQKD